MFIADPYVKLCMAVNGKKGDKKKTKTKEKTLNPVYNETFTFNLANEKIRAGSLYLEVYDNDKFNKDDVIGVVEIGPGKGTTGNSHWNEMMNAKGQAASKWHALKPADD